MLDAGFIGLLLMRIKGCEFALNKRLVIKSKGAKGV